MSQEMSVKLILSIDYQLDIPFFYILKASPIQTILDHGDLSSCLRVLVGSLPQDPILPHSCSQVSMKRVSSLCPSCCQPMPCRQSLSFPLTTVGVIWLICSICCFDNIVFERQKNTCIRLELPLLSDAVLNVDYKVWSFFPGVGHWQVTAFFCSLPSCPCSGDGACSLLHGPVQCSFLIFQQRHYLLLSCLSYLRTSILSSGSQPCYHGDYHETYHTHFLFFTVLYICVTSFLIL